MCRAIAIEEPPSPLLRFRCCFRHSWWHWGQSNCDLRPGSGSSSMAAAVVEAGLASRMEIQTYPVWPRRAWGSLWLTVVTIQLLALLKGSWPYLPQLSLLAGLGVLWWVRIDRDLLQRAFIPVWVFFSAAMLVLLPVGLLDGSTSVEVTEPLSESSPYWNSALSVFGLRRALVGDVHAPEWAGGVLSHRDWPGVVEHTGVMAVAGPLNASPPHLFVTDCWHSRDSWDDRLRGHSREAEGPLGSGDGHGARRADHIPVTR